MADDDALLVFDDEVVEAITTSAAEHNALTVAYIGGDGWAHVSKRSSTIVLDERTIGLWARKPDSGMAPGVVANPRVTLLFVDFATRGVMYTFYGHARLSDSAEIGERVWSTMPAVERELDPERRGVAIVVEVDRLEAVGRRPERNFVLTR